MIGLLAASIPNGIAGVTVRSVKLAYEEALRTRVATLINRVSEEQARDTESPIQCFRRIQRELGEASERLRRISQEIKADEVNQADDSEFDQQLGKAFGLSLGCLVQSGSKHLEPLIEFMCGKAK
eukprot:g17321.t1